MTLLPPSIPGRTLEAGYLGGLVPYPNVQPFTVRSGITYQAMLESMSEWINYTLIPYLNEDSWDTLSTALIAAVDAALADQKADVNAAIAQAIQDFAQGHLNVTDPSILAVLTASVQTQTRAWLDGQYAAKADLTALTNKFNGTRVFYAPDPSGGDDTPALMAAINLAATVRGELILGYGTYNVSQLLINDQFQQPLIKGRGADYTAIHGTPATNGKAVVKFQGGSGALSGGGLRDLAIVGWDNNSNIAGVELSGCGHVTIRDCKISNVNIAVRFHNEQTGDFTEFCTFENGSVDSVHQFMRYDVDNGVESFHGSGSVGNNIVNVIAEAGPIVQATGIALPYNAPLDMCVFINHAGRYLYDYGNSAAGRHASHYGHIRVEGNGGMANGSQMGRSGNGNRILLNGDISWLGSGQAALGALFLTNKISYEGGFVGAEYKPVSHRFLLKNSPTQGLANILQPGETGLISCHILGGNYDKSYLLMVYQSPYNDGGSVTVLGQPSNIDNASIGNPTFTWGGNGLYIANPNFSNAQTALCTLTPLGGHNRVNLLPQFVS